MLSSRMKVHLGKRRRYGQIRALALMVSLLFPLAQLAFSSSQIPENLLPACCRTHGKHKCAFSLEENSKGNVSAGSSSRQIAQIGEKCPCPLALLPSSHSQPFWNHHSAKRSFPADESWELIRCVQVTRFSFPEGSNQKRGPPNSNISA